MKLSEFYKKSEKDIIVWYEEMRRVTLANNWKDTRVYIIITFYLKGVVTNFYKKVKDNVTNR